MKKPSISEYKTFAMLQTNVPKIQYGSGIVGAGFKDVYQDFKQVRGKFVQKSGTRQLTDGTIAPTTSYKFTFRYTTEIMGIIDLQLRLLIKGKTYTLNSYDVDISGKANLFIFDLSQYGK